MRVVVRLGSHPTPCTFIHGSQTNQSVTPVLMFSWYLVQTNQSVTPVLMFSRYLLQTNVVFAVFSAIRQGYRPPMPTAEKEKVRIVERSVSQSVERSVSQRLKAGASKLIGGGGARNAETTTTTTTTTGPSLIFSTVTVPSFQN